MLVINAHMHLNGSVSQEYLKETAERNGCMAAYDGFVAETNVWAKFGYIHKIMQNMDDIYRATVDVICCSKADFLEIRTTPKPLGNQDKEAYIAAFVQGLQEAQSKFPNKHARGLLSIDRSRHTLEDAKWIIDAAVMEKERSGMIVGIDLSGNFLADRKLTGTDLEEAIKYALSKDIGLALHVGEIDSEIEQRDFDIILAAIDAYEGKIHGKVRLGHAIYRTSEQDAMIAKHEIPIEICPSCHEQLDWAKEGMPHPILTLYRHRKQVIAGTDDNVIFNCNAEQEQRKLDKMMSVSDEFLSLSPEEQALQIAACRKRFLFS